MRILQPYGCIELKKNTGGLPPTGTTTSRKLNTGEDYRGAMIVDRNTIYNIKIF